MIDVCVDFHMTRVSLSVFPRGGRSKFSVSGWTIFISSTASINRKWEHFSHISTIAITPIVFSRMGRTAV